MNYYDTAVYKQELEEIISKYRNSFVDGSLMVTGACGMIGSMLVDAVMLANWEYGMNCKLYAVVRNEAAARKRFEKYMNRQLFRLIIADINKDAVNGVVGSVDYIIHAASNTHPRLYAGKPIETILTNVVGTNNLLEFAVCHGCRRFLFLSSVEIYGVNRQEQRKFTEDACGYIDSNTLRAGYPEGKRTGEALCQAYKKEHNLESVILRLARCYGPGILKNDSKALSQFLCNAKEHKDIVLKSGGGQHYSYVYQADAVDAILHFLQFGESGEAYNITGIDSDMTLKELAEMISNFAHVQVRFEFPNVEEAAGYSRATEALLDGGKAAKAGWTARYGIRQGIRRCLNQDVGGKDGL